MVAMPYPLEPGPEQMRAMGEAALGYLVEFVQSQDEAAAMDVEGAIEAARGVRGAPPDGPGSFDQLMDKLDRQVVRHKDKVQNHHHEAPKRTYATLS